MISERATTASYAEQIEANYQAARTVAKRAKLRFRIAPRWGCGSPADQSIDVVTRAALDDVRSHYHAIEGAYGEAQQETAKADGALKDIAYAYWFRRCHWHRVDLLTGETTLSPENTYAKRCQHTRITVTEWDKRRDQAMADMNHDALADLFTYRAQLLGKAR